MKAASKMYRLVPMTGAHLDDVLSIERVSQSHPWPRQAFEQELKATSVSRSRVALSREDEEPTVAGFCVAWLVVDHVQIQNVAVHPEHRRRGLATYLLEEAFSHARTYGAVSAFLEVRRSNLTARRLYERLGFREAGERKGYYSCPSEDAVVLHKELTREPIET
jgi:ribosomal-protein-alanine N-acetyltransferase